MKKLIFLCLIACFTLTLQACAPGEALQQISEKAEEIEQEPEQSPSSPRERVYMDQIKGTLLDFSGSTISLKSEDLIYHFDISDASVECSDGLITGDEIDVIYEGKLPEHSQDTSSVKVLKIVDDYHHQSDLEEQVISGTLKQLSTNTLSLVTEDKKEVTFTITGSEQYFENGLHTGMKLYLHYYGKLTADSLDVSNTGRLKIISISDQEPFSINTKKFPVKEEGTEEEKVFILRIENQTLHVLKQDRETTMEIDLSSIPSYFSGGITQGSVATLISTGNEEQKKNLRVVGQSIARLRSTDSTFHVDGVILAHTADTITIQTEDQATITARSEKASSLETGTSIKVFFHPGENKKTNIINAIRIETE